jgi:glyoxylase-like metal-dependent hydrolase (beta-lactamase superfamily II)
MDLAQSPAAHLHDRRRLLKFAIFSGLVGLAPPVALAAEEAAPTPLPAMPPMPIVDARFPAEIAPGVFILPDKRIPLVPNIGIIVGRRKVLVVDTGLGIVSGQNVLNVVRQLAPGRQIVLTITHAHPEHAFGAQAFKPDAHIYYNSAQRDYLLRSGAKLLDGFRSFLPPEQKRLLDDVRLTPPDETYDGSRSTLDLGGRRVEFRTWGTAHTPGDQIIHLPKENILFAGDLLEERMFPIIPLFPPMIDADDIDVTQWEVALADILRLQPRLIVPGHGSLGGAEVASDVLGYFKEVRALVKAGSGSRDGLVAQIRARYPTWEGGQFIGPAVQYFSQRP